MGVSLIVAVSENDVIGKDNDLIWSLPKDMEYFKDTTQGHFVIMGRKNFESIPHKFRPLPNRTNVVVTRQMSYQAEGCIVVHTLEDALKKSKEGSDSEPFIIGGGEIYQLALNKGLVDRIYLTRIHHKFDGDTFFPKLGNEWKLISSEAHQKDDKHQWDYDFQIFIK